MIATDYKTSLKKIIFGLTFRSWFVISIFGLLMVGLGWRLFDLHVLNQHFLRSQGDARTLRTIPISAHRGVIADRNGEPLAVSAPVMSVWVNPQSFPADPAMIKLLSEHLNISTDYVQERLRTQANREFVYLKRQLPPQEAQEIKALNLPGVFLEREYRRFYPTGEVSAHVLGFTDIDGQGQEGMEYAYDAVLSGVPGARKVLKDRVGRVIDEIEHIQDPKPGDNIYLSIDRRIQYLAYQELVSAIEQNQAESGSIVVTDVQTGEILAMVNYPSFNPNSRYDRDANSRRNRAVTDVFEPGSVMKVFSMAAGLASGAVSAETMVDTHPGTLQVRGKTVRDVVNYGLIDMTGVLRHSSNIGITHVILATPFQQYVDTLHDFGFGAPTASGFPGERSGHINLPKDHDEHGKATMAFGYGLSVTPLQLAQAYATIANDGKYVPVTFMKMSEVPAGEQVLDPNLALQLQDMLTHVVHDKRGVYRAKIPGYQVAGKSGTARKATVEGGYQAKRYTSLFAGFVPATRPEISAVIVIDDPKSGAYYGGEVAAPVFSRVMAGALRLLNIQPDGIEINEQGEPLQLAHIDR